MKNPNYANRGQTLEFFIKYANRAYRDLGIAVISKQPTEFIPLRDATGRIVSCKVASKATVDFIGRVGSRPIAIEAKETRTDNIRFDRVEDHQAEFMDDYTRDEAGDGVVLVSFNLDHFYAIPWAFWKAAREAWIKKPKSKLTIEYKGQTWTTPGKASVKRAELLPEWEVKTGGRVGLDYLAAYRR